MYALLNSDEEENEILANFDVTETMEKVEKQYDQK